MKTESQRAMVAAEIANLEQGVYYGNQHQEGSANLREAPSQKQAAEMLNVSDPVPGSKRSAQFQRKCAQALSAIEAGRILPAVKPVCACVNCSPRTASAILTKLVTDDARFSRDTRGRIAFDGVGG